MSAGEAAPIDGARPQPAAAGRLAELRGEIDRIDGEMHRLVMARAQVVEAIRAAKGEEARAIVIRPEREAAILARLAAQHAGPLPFAVIAHVWRTLIAAFCGLQRPFAVILAGEDPALLDLARFHAGFDAPVTVAADAAAALDALAKAPGDIAVLPLGPSPDPWWHRLGEGGLHPVALLPGTLVGRDGRDALVVGGRNVGPGGTGIDLVAVTGAAPAGLGDAPVLATAGPERLLAARADASGTTRPIGRLAPLPAALAGPHPSRANEAG